MGRRHKLDSRYKTYKMSSPRLMAQISDVKVNNKSVGNWAKPYEDASRVEKSGQSTSEKANKVAGSIKTSTGGKAGIASAVKKGKQEAGQQTKANSRSATSVKSAWRERSSRPHGVQQRKSARSLGGYHGEGGQTALCGQERRERSYSPLHSFFFPQHQARNPQFNLSPLRFADLSGTMKKEEPFEKASIDLTLASYSKTKLVACDRCMAIKQDAACGQSSQQDLASTMSVGKGDQTSTNGFGETVKMTGTEKISINRSVSCQILSEKESKAVQVNSGLFPANKQDIAPKKTHFKRSSIAMEQRKLNAAKYPPCSGIQRDFQNSNKCKLSTQAVGDHRNVNQTSLIPIKAHVGQGKPRICEAESQTRKGVSAPRQNARGTANVQNGERRGHAAIPIRQLHLTERKVGGSTLLCQGVISPHHGDRGCGSGTDNICEPGQDLSCTKQDIAVADNPKKGHFQTCFPFLKNVVERIAKCISPAWYLLRHYSLPNDYYQIDGSDFPGSSVDAIPEAHPVFESSVTYKVHPVQNLKNVPTTRRNIQSFRYSPARVAPDARKDKDGKLSPMRCNYLKAKQVLYSSAGTSDNSATHLQGNSTNNTFAQAITLLDGCVGDLLAGKTGIPCVYPRENLDWRQNCGTDSLGPAVCESLSEEIFHNARRAHPFFYSVDSMATMWEQNQRRAANACQDFKVHGQNCIFPSAKPAAPKAITRERIASSADMTIFERHVKDRDVLSCMKTLGHSPVQQCPLSRRSERGLYSLDTLRHNSSPPKSDKVIARFGSLTTRGLKANLPLLRKKVHHF